jgi:hypothetical protein
MTLDHPSNAITDLAKVFSLPDPKGLARDCRFLSNGVPEGNLSRTTNGVWLAGGYVFKHFSSLEAYLTERAVYDHNYLWSFRLPKLIGGLSNERIGNWLTTAFVPGIPIKALPQEAIGEVVVAIVGALHNFECNATRLPGIRFRRRLWSSSLRGLVEVCRPLPVKNIIRDILEIADSLASTSAYVPCFDAHHRNLVIERPTTNEQRRSIVFLDFEKANWLVPAGEQLSHIVSFPITARWSEQALFQYASHHDVSPSSLEPIVTISTFFRALAGIRDALRWIPRGGTAEDCACSKETHINVISECVAIAKGKLPALSNALRLSPDQVHGLSHFLGMFDGTEFNRPCTEIRAVSERIESISPGH